MDRKKYLKRVAKRIANLEKQVGKDGVSESEVANLMEKEIAHLTLEEIIEVSDLVEQYLHS